jgi:hypothetical protein
LDEEMYNVEPNAAFEALHIRLVLEKYMESLQVVLCERFAISRTCIRKSLNNMLRNCLHGLYLEFRDASFDNHSYRIGGRRKSRGGSR